MKTSTKKVGILAAAAIAMIGTAAAAQPYGGYDRGYVGQYQHQSYRGHDRDRDGIPDRYDRYDNRRDRHRHHDRYEQVRPSYGYGYGYAAPSRTYNGW